MVDPHKHGLQPYGCGAVLFADPAVGRFYSHDSPYTYFTSDELHLGEISLECSRAGRGGGRAVAHVPAAAAAAGRARAGAGGRPPGRAGLGRSCSPASDRLRLYQRPELDIVCYFPVTARASLAAIDQASARMLADGMKDPAHPVFRQHPAPSTRTRSPAATRTSPRTPAGPGSCAAS